jgi:hypothetical protein
MWSEIARVLVYIAMAAHGGREGEFGRASGTEVEPRDFLWRMSVAMDGAL